MPGIFILCLCYQWIQVFGTVAYATYVDQPVNFRSPHNGTAIIWSLLGLMVITIAVRVMLKKFKEVS
ncbi:MAG: hypothetical protein ABUT20_37865, partial [Bacteroidota bacterium]